MIYGIFMFFHVVISFLLVVVILMQSSKGGGLAGSIGGSGMAGSVLGGRGAAPFLVKATTVLAVLFMTTSLTLTFMRRETVNESVLEKAFRGSAPVQGSAPAVTDQMPMPALDQETQPVETGAEEATQ